MKRLRQYLPLFRSGKHSEQQDVEQVVQHPVSRATAMIVAFATLATAGITGAVASGGSGSTGGSGGGAAELGSFWEQGDSIDSPTNEGVERVIAGHGVTVVGNGKEAINLATTRARYDCEQNYYSHGGTGDPKCRLVGVGLVYDKTRNNTFNATPLWPNEIQRQFDNAMLGGPWKHNQDYYTADSPFYDQPDMTLRKLTNSAITSTSNLVVVMLNANQPAPANYKLAVDTVASHAADWVQDTVRTNRNGSSISEQVTGESRLHVDNLFGVHDQAALDLKQGFTMPNEGSVVVNKRMAVDLGFDKLPAGRYQYYTTVSKQGKMSNSVDNHTSDSETFTVAPNKTVGKKLYRWEDSSRTPIPDGMRVAPDQHYGVELTAAANGSSKLVFRDVITNPRSWVGLHTGSNDTSSVQAVDEYGNRYPVSTRVEPFNHDTEHGDYMLVTSTVDITPQNIAGKRVRTVGNIMLRFPVTVDTGHAETPQSDAANICWDNADKECADTPGHHVNIPNPHPTKHWSSNKQEAENVPDSPAPAAADGKGFVEGDSVYATVTGSIPQRLISPFNEYAITDDWHEARQYVDFSHGSGVTVLFNGVDHTNWFDIHVDTERGITTATANGLGLAGMSLTGGKIQLILSGVAKNSPERGWTGKLVNKGKERWNKREEPTNEPPTVVYGFKPSKTWASTREEAMRVEDSGWTNKTGADGKILLPKGVVYTSVTGKLPRDLATYSEYTIADDWTESRHLIDFNHDSDAKVYVDGQDKTSLFTIRTSGTVTTATLTNPSSIPHLSERDNEQEIDIKLVLRGIANEQEIEKATKKEHDHWANNGGTTDIINAGWQKLNKLNRPTNKPPLRVWQGHPHKEWTTSEHSAEFVGSFGNIVDGRNFLVGDTIGSKVRQPVPFGNLVNPLTHFEIRDTTNEQGEKIDWNKFKVFVDSTKNAGEVTDEFDITNNNGTVTAVAKKSFLDRLNSNNGQINAVQLAISGKVRENAVPEGTCQPVNNTAKTEFRQGKGEDTTNIDFTERDSNHVIGICKIKPNKSWVHTLDVPAGTAWNKIGVDYAADPAWTNKTGADGTSVRLGDHVAAWVSMLLPAYQIGVTSLQAINDDPSKFTTGAGSWLTPISKNPEDSDVWAWTVDDPTVTKPVQQGYQLNHYEQTIPAHAVRFNTSEQNWQQKLMDKVKAMSYEEGGKPVQVARVYKFATSPTSQADRILQAYGRTREQGLTSCTTSTGEQAVNKGSVVMNTITAPTNEPALCITIPPVAKQVVGSPMENSAATTIDTRKVVPNEQVRYTIDIDPSVMSRNQYRTIKQVQFADNYDVNLVPLLNTVGVKTSTGQWLHQGKDYTLTHDEHNHLLVIDFTQQYVASHFNTADMKKLTLQFEGKVKSRSELVDTTNEKAAGCNADVTAPCSNIVNGSHSVTVVNNAWLNINNHGKLHSNSVENPTTTTKPHKQVTTNEPTVDINGLKLKRGDTAYYRVTLDASDITHNAYKLKRLGMVDKYDNEYLTPITKDIKVVRDDGKDVTNLATVQDHDGTMYVFFTPVQERNLLTDQTMGTLPFNGMPIAQYATTPVDSLHSGVMPEEVYGHTFTVIMPFTVIKADNSHTVDNTATQIMNNDSVVTNTVTNGLVEPNPSKDIVFKVGGESKDKHSVYLNRQFLYQLDSSVLPADRAYKTVQEWSITDHYDAAHDQFTGKWAVYSQYDITDSHGNIIIKKGERIAGSDYTNSRGELFTLTPLTPTANTAQADSEHSSETDDENGKHDDAATHGNPAHSEHSDSTLKVESEQAENTHTQDNSTSDNSVNSDQDSANNPAEGSFKVSATPAMLELFKDSKNNIGFTVFVKFDRYAASPEVKNTFTETMNNIERVSNTVVTHTPDETPTISIVKYDEKSGVVEGDRATPELALHNANNGTVIRFKITNTGKAPLHKLKLTDVTVAGVGKVKNIHHPANWNTLTLQPNQSVEAWGTLEEMQEGGYHTDRATVTATPLTSCKADDTMLGSDNTSEHDSTSGEHDDHNPKKESEKAENTHTQNNATSENSVNEKPERTLCDDTPIQASNDWNGVAPKPLAHTGVGDIMLLICASTLAVIIAIGIIGYTRTRKQENKETTQQQ